MAAVLGGATSLAAIARFAADTDSDLREQLGLTSSTPNASTLGRLLARLDGDALDDVVGAWLARYAADPVDEPGDTLVGLAVDGQTVRGSRTDGAAVHLLAAALHACQTVIAHRQIAAKSNEIPAFAPLLNRIALRDVVVTADATHTRRAHAEHVITADGHYLLVVKGNQKKLRKQLRRLPWKQIPPEAHTTGAGHVRREIRRPKACTVRPGLLFPHAVQAMQIERRRTHHKTGKAETKTVHAITSLPPEQAGPPQLAELAQNHWSVRPCTPSETPPTTRTPHEYARAPHLAPWPPFATLPSDSCAEQAGPTSPPQPIITGHAPSTRPPCSGSQPENASPLG